MSWHIRRAGAEKVIVVVFGLIGSLVGPAESTAQSVRGIVSGDVTEIALELATVEAISHAGRVVASALTDVRGFFDLRLPGDGEYILRATALGFEPGRSDAFMIEDDGAQIIYLNLLPAPIELEGLTVRTDGVEASGLSPSLSARGFYERLEKGRGQFLTPGEVIASDAFFTTQLFDEMRGVLQNYGVPVWTRSVRYIAATERGNCGPRIFIDGIRISMLLREGVYFSDMVPIEDVLAVEVFWGPFQAPMIYQGTMLDNSCGVVLIWTRQRTRL
jgi:hypothetical protein